MTGAHPGVEGRREPAPYFRGNFLPGGTFLPGGIYLPSGSYLPGGTCLHGSHRTPFGGNYMLACRLTLGIASTYGGNSAAQDGDHVWVPSYGGSGCYVIAEPDQILPQFIVQFGGSGYASCPKLDRALASHYSISGQVGAEFRD